jgi:dTDP-4-dehydrorhamnose reductase
MKVLVTGAGGLLGSDVWKRFGQRHDLVALGRNRPRQVPLNQWRECDLRDAVITYSTVTKENPDLIVHCASYNDVDGAETHPDEAFQTNAIGARNLALACQRFDTVLMAISTDYVFDGSEAPAEGYREFDSARPQGVYAASKRWAEIHVEQLLSKFYIVRTSWLFGEARATFADRVVEWAAAGQPVPCLTDMHSIPTFTPDLAEALEQLAQSGCYGLYHLTNAGICNRAEFAGEILRLHKLSEKLIKPMTQAEFNHPAKRPTFSGLQNLAWRLNGFPPIRSWKEALRQHFGVEATSR